MFTGLILELGEAVSLKKGTEGGILTVKAPESSQDAAMGDSIAVNGICLTVVAINKELLSFDVSSETLRSTNLGGLKSGEKVNLEPSLRPNSRMGGHFVTGHVEDVGRIRSRSQTGNAVRIEIEAPEGVLKYLVEKGSVAVDGISLTVVDVMRDAFSLVIIPHTARMSTIGIKGKGETVNLEPDILGKYVAKFLSRGNEDSDSRLLSALKGSGFIP
ncbi:MAG: riboflavin synthase [Nitrospirales bacterium]|nr:riboflavin synthase [Nitrospirales bacterium]